MLYDIAKILNMTVDGLLNEEAWAKRQITYMDTGLDTRKLYELKNDVQKLVSDDKRIVSSWYADACLFQMDTSQMKDPVYSCVTCIPGSKEKMAKEYHYNKEICADVAASAINFTLQHGIRPSVLKAFVLCGNYDYEQLYMMAQTFQEVCKQNDMLFTGMEIAAQPVNFSSQEYNINATVVGVQDRDKLLNYEKIKEGDALIGMRTQGIDGTHYPIIKVMLDRRPDLLHAKIDEEYFLLEEMMKANVAYTREIMSLQECGYLHGAFRVHNSLFRNKGWRELPDGLYACVDMTKIPVLPLFRFLYEQDMIGADVFPHRFHMGIGMVVVVPADKCQEAMQVIGQYTECWNIGEIRADKEHKEEKIKKKKLFYDIGIRYVWILCIYVVMSISLNEIVVRGNDYIAQVTDSMLTGKPVVLQNILIQMSGMIIVGTVAAYFADLSRKYYSSLVQREVRGRLAEHLLHLPYSYFDEKGSGSILTRFSSDIGEAGNFFSDILPDLLVDIVTVGTITAYFIQMDVRLIVILFASYPVMLLVADRLSKKLAVILRKFRTTMDDRTQIAYDAIQGIAIGKSYNLYHVMCARINAAIDKIADHGCKSTRISSMGW